MNELTVREKYTFEWNMLPSNVKSIIISIGAFLLSISLLAVAKTAFPNYDTSLLEAALLTAFSGFLVNLINNFIKV